MSSDRAPSFSPLRVWDKVTLITGRGPKLGIYETRIENIINGGLVITDPEFIRGSSKLSDDCKIKVQFSRPDAIYQFESTLKSVKLEGRQQVILSPPRSYHRVQRRMFVRLGFRRDMLYAVVPHDMNWRDWEDTLVWNAATTADVSGSGLLIEGAYDISKDDLLLLKLPFFREIGLADPVAAYCRRNTVDSDDNLLMGVELILGRDLTDFVDEASLGLLPRSVTRFDLQEQMKLSHYVFNQQIQRRRQKTPSHVS